MSNSSRAIIYGLSAILLNYGGLSLPGAFSASEPIHDSDEASIRAQASAYEKAFAAADVDKLSSMWDKDAIYIDQFGKILRGRDEIKKQYRDFFSKKGEQPIQISFESLQFPSDDLAIESGSSRLLNCSSPAGSARYLAVHVKRNGSWLMASVTESPLDAAGMGGYLRPLDWLVGLWKVEGDESSLRLNFKRVGDNLISCDAEAKPGNGAAKSHTEYIYWNPQTRCISSFQFDSLGGVAQKSWQKSAGDWIVHAFSLQSDGSESKADYIIKPMGKDCFSWQSKHRIVDGEQLPDTERITLSRVKS